MNAVSPPDRIRWCGKTRGREGKEGQAAVRREGVQGESDSHYKRHKRLSPQRAREIAQNEDGPGGGWRGREGGRLRWRTMQGVLATDQSAMRTGAGQDTRKRTRTRRRRKGSTGGEMLVEGERTDGSRCEGGGRVSTGEELCFRSSLARNVFPSCR